MKTPTNGFIRLERANWNSDQWRALSAHARVLLIDMQCAYNGRNNGNLAYSHAHAIACLKCSKSTAKRAFRELKAASLIEVTVSGSFSNKAGARKGEATKWRGAQLSCGRLRYSAVAANH